MGLFCGLSSLNKTPQEKENHFWVIAAPIGITTHNFKIFACQVLHFYFGDNSCIINGSICFNPLVYVAVILGMALTLFTSGKLKYDFRLINPYLLENPAGIVVQE